MGCASSNTATPSEQSQRPTERTPARSEEKPKPSAPIQTETQENFAMDEHAEANPEPQEGRSGSDKVAPTSVDNGDQPSPETMDSDISEAQNEYSGSMQLPEMSLKLPVDYPCLRGKGNAKWPIHCFAALDYNVNAKHGGCAGLMQISNAYGGDGADTTAQVLLFRSGFDGNHMSIIGLAKCNHGHFGAQNGFETDEVGRLHPKCMFGSNHVSFICNDSRYGNLDHGLLVEGSQDGSTDLPVNVNGAAEGGHGAGTTVVLCGGWESGMDEANFVSAVYIVRSGHKDSHCQAILLKGEDKWKFDCDGEGTLNVDGPGRTMFALYHNRESNLDNNMGQVRGKSRAFHCETLDGKEPTDILLNADSLSGVFLMLCSNTSGIEDSSCAAIYMLSLANGELASTLVGDQAGSTYRESSGDLWKFELSKGNIITKGPAGPCRYAFISNLPGSGTASSTQGRCLATGEKEPIGGAVTVTEDAVTGWVSKESTVIVKDNEKVLFKFSADQLLKAGDRKAFSRKWMKEEKTVGLHLVRVFALRKHAEARSVQEIELDGSPRHLIRQPKGVVYALNSCGPAYQALDDIVYKSEFSEYASYTYDFVFGSSCRALGGMKTQGSIPHILNGGQDGFMHVGCRSSGVEPEDEQKVHYDVNGLPNGKMTLRFHCVPRNIGNITCNGNNITSKIQSGVNTIKAVAEGATMHSADVPITVSGGELKLHMTNQMISAFAVFSKDYNKKKLTKEEQRLEAEEKHRIADDVEPLTRSLTRKEMKIVGWSPNLLINASGEMGTMAHWNTSGSWGVQGGGYQTEKAFNTSHMACVKYQEVDLTEHFSAEYLDTAPDIQVSEWYREGCGGGGFYRFKATIMDGRGDTIDDYALPETPNLYRDSKWTQELHTFKGYGSGVRRVGIESYGKDDKYWAGSYGPIISNAVIRIKRESTPVKDDTFQDIIKGDDELQAYAAVREKLVSRVFSDNQELLKELVEEQVVPLVDSSFQKQADMNQQRKPRRRKKREIRVFVSSTFRDFTKEREQLIKKTFREINGLCSDRGVFFTYVDLRWGITEEQTNHGQTIAICLQEIGRCRPYFICMMGDRFGWCQKEGEQDKTLDSSYDYAVQNFPKELGWVDVHRYSTSVTQLEILHGVLNDIDNRKDRSFFYLRDPIVKEAWPEDDYKKMSSESDWHHEKQYTLREQVAKLGQLNRRTYTMPLDVCDLIKKDLEWCIEQDFPKGTELSPLEREKEAHLAFGDARRRVYIGRQEYFNQIDEFMGKESKTPLVILGESGSGKSALVANWVGKLEEKEPNIFVFVHFIGSSAESASYIKLLRRLYEELKNYFGFSLAVPASDANLVRDLPTWLKMAGTQSKCVLVFDALNQLDDGSGEEGAEHDLLWIPRELPSGVQILLSTLPGKAFEAVTAANWTSMKVHPLQPSEKMQIVTGYLEDIYGKTLSQEQKTMIVDAPQTNNALYLKALMDEVRVFGSFRSLTPKIQEYLVASSPGELFAKILERLEVDFEKGQQGNRPGLVRDTTVAIWCSHRGMSEAELLELLQIPSAVWSPFYLSLVENLVNRNGILNFFHDHLRQAVESKYLPTASEKKQGYEKLAQYFSERSLDDRVVDELPYLLAKANKLDELRSTISDLEVFRRMVHTEDGKFDLIKSWTLLGDFSQVEPAYMKPLEELSAPQDTAEKEQRTRLKQDLAEFFMDLGLFDAARSMFESLLTNLEEQLKDSHSTIVYHHFNQTRKHKCNHPSVIAILHRLGTVCQKQQHYKNAAHYYHDAIARQNKVQSPSQKLQLTEGLLGQATVLTMEGDMQEAKKFLIRAQELAVDVLGSRHHFVAAIINKLGQLSYKQGRIEEALAYFIQDLNLTRNEVGTTHPRTAGIINEIALVYDDKNDPQAKDLYEAALTILLDVYGLSHLDVAVTRYNLGAFYFATNSFARAKFQFTEAQKICDAFLGGEHAETVAATQALEDVSAFVR